MIFYETLMDMSGEKCYTLTADNPAEMYVDDQKITIVYPSGNSLQIPRALVMQAISMLMLKRKLTVADVHEEITQGNGARTDRLMAVIRKLPGITFDRRPRGLYSRTVELIAIIKQVNHIFSTAHSCNLTLILFSYIINHPRKVDSLYEVIKRRGGIPLVHQINLNHI